MANELRIKVVFDTGQAKRPVEEFAEGSVGALEKRVKQLHQELRRAQEGTEAHTKALVAYKEAQAKAAEATGRGFTAIKNSTGAAANAATTMQALNYTIRDSAYFGRDFSLGLLAVGNNLNPLIDGFIRMKGELKAGQTMWQAITSSMTGAQWAILGFSAAISIIQALTFAFASAKDEADALKSSVDELVKAKNPFENWTFEFTADEIDKMLSVIDKRISDIEKNRRAQVTPGAGGIVDLIEQWIGGENTAPEQVARRLEELKKNLQAQKEIVDLFGELGKKPTIKDKKGKETNRWDLILEEMDAKIEDFRQRIQEDEEMTRDAIQQFDNYQQARLEAEKLLREYKTKAIDDEYQRKRANLDRIYQDEIDRIEKLEEIYGAPLTDLRMEAGKAKERGLTDLDREQRQQDTENWLKAVEKRTKDIESISNSVGDSIYSAFLHGKQGVEEFIKSIEMAIAKMLIMEALSAVIGSFSAPAMLPIPALQSIEGSGKGIGAFLGSFGGGKAPIPNISRTFNAPISSSAGLQQSMQAMNANIAGMREPIIMIQADTDAVRFTRTKTNPAQAKLARANISVI